MHYTLRLFSCLCILLATYACSDGSDSRSDRNLPVYDFSEVDAQLQQFLDEQAALNGISVILVDRLQGTIHKASFGDHTPDTVVLIASVTKFSTATLLMAIHDDDALEFDVDASIDNYLAWEGVYGDRTTTQLLSNTSGIPGISGGNEDHACQYDADDTLERCAMHNYATELPGTKPPETVFDYGGSQWHLAGAVATQVTNSEYSQAFDRYIAQPCALEVYEVGNTATDPLHFTGDPDSLTGRGNPHGGGGAITNMQDMAELLLLHIREGKCGDNRVMSPEAVAFMQVDRKGDLPSTVAAWEDRSYGMGWWGNEALPDVIYDSGLYGSIAWIDTRRMVGGFVAVEDYATTGASFQTIRFVQNEIIPLVGELVDEAREAAIE